MFIPLLWLPQVLQLPQMLILPSSASSDRGLKQIAFRDSGFWYATRSLVPVGRYCLLYSNFFLTQTGNLVTQVNDFVVVVLIFPVKS